MIDDAEPGPGTVQAANVVTEAKAGSAVAAGAHAKNGGFIKDGVSTDGGLDTDVIAVDASDGNDEDTSDGVIPPVALPTGAELPSIAVKSPHRNSPRPSCRPRSHDKLCCQNEPTRHLRHPSTRGLLGPRRRRRVHQELS